MAKVKICGITNLEDALAAFFNQADAIGFIFYKKSPRYIEPQKARNIARILPKEILKVGVFVDEGEKAIKRIAKLCSLDLLQFHGSESAEFCAKFKGYKVIKVFRVKKSLDLKLLNEYKTYAFLFDAFSKAKIGGTGEKFDWNLLKKVGRINRKIFLSGGLNSTNIRRAIKNINPDWVDLSSSVEISPGKKSHKKLRDVIGKVK